MIGIGLGFLARAIDMNNPPKKREHKMLTWPDAFALVGVAFAVAWMIRSL